MLNRVQCVIIICVTVRTIPAAVSDEPAQRLMTIIHLFATCLQHRYHKNLTRS